MADRRYALVVATSDYRDKNFRKLTTPGFDAKALAKVLRDPNVGMFKLTILVNKDAHVIEQGIERFCAGRAVDDTLLLYFSGHGVKDDAGNLYLAARNTTQPLLRSTGVSDAFLRDVMKSCRARRQVLILDCCFGGAFAKGLLAKAGGDTVGVNERFQGQGRVILTASNAMEFAFEDGGVKGETRLSVFTRTLVSGLQSGEADIDGDGQISVQDLYNYAYKRIALPGSRQTPTISAVGQEGEIILARVPEAARARKASRALMTVGTPSARRLDLRPWVRIRDQGSEGSNPAVAAVTALETVFALRGSDIRLSPRYVYQKAKQLDEQNQDADLGMNMETLIRVLQEFGAPPEEAWPYVPGKWQMPKNANWENLDEQAQPYRARLISVTAADEIPLHLAKGRPVLGSFNVHESMWYGTDTTQRGVIRKPPAKNENPLIGSIALTIVDFDETRKVIHFAHTWGPAWGNLGFGEMALDTAQAIFAGEQMWAVEARSSGPFLWSGPTPFTPPQAQAAAPLSANDLVSPPSQPAAVPVKVDTAAGRQSTITRSQRAARKERHPEPATGPMSGKPHRKVFNANYQQGDWSVAKLPAKALARTEGSAPTGDPAIDDTYDALGRVYDFFQLTFQRDSWDGKGAPLEAVVHFGRNFENAFWDGRRVVLGDGGTVMKTFCRLDIIAKECSTGLLQSETKLRYEGQSGALFQSVALVFASMVKQYVLKQTAMDANWLVGDGLIADGKALMSLEQPGTAYNNAVLGQDSQIGHMSKYRKVAFDNGGIHINCGIPNRAFVLAAKGLGGYSWEVAGRIWYAAVCGGKLGAHTTFARFATQTIAEAKKSFNASVARTIRSAWLKVGVHV